MSTKQAYELAHCLFNSNLKPGLDLHNQAEDAHGQNGCRNHIHFILIAEPSVQSAPSTSSKCDKLQLKPEIPAFIVALTSMTRTFAEKPCGEARFITEMRTRVANQPVSPKNKMLSYLRWTCEFNEENQQNQPLCKHIIFCCAR